MPKMTKCAICKQTGGRFRFRSGIGDYVHVGRCVPEAKPLNGTHANWPIVTEHLGGPNLGPVVIENLQQLRAAEKQYGCSSEAYNMDRSNRSE
jgi:hypothetical protein